MEPLEDRVLFDAVPDAIDIIDTTNVDDLVVETPESIAHVVSNQSVSANSRHEIVFIDGSIEGVDRLLADLLLEKSEHSLELHLLDTDSDGVQQIAEIMASRSDVDAIHILSHGSQGELRLGTATLSIESMTGEYADALATINAALSEDADLLLYGCRFGEGVAGASAAALLSDLTGADVGASTDDTGIESRGGDWDLERTIGELESAVIVSADLQTQWNVLLATPVLDLDASNTATGADFEATFIEGGSPIAIADTDTLVTDVDDTNIESAVASITNSQTGDVLSALDGDVSCPLGSSRA